MTKEDEAALFARVEERLKEAKRYVMGFVILDVAETETLRALAQAGRDDPEMDATDFAHPAWWRGEEHAFSRACEHVNAILDGRDAGHGTSREPWHSTRQRLVALAQAKGGGIKTLGDEPWLPMVFCPTDGVERLLKLPDGTEAVGCFRNPPGRWRVWSETIKRPPIDLKPIGGVPRQSAPWETRVYRDLPEGVFPTHFRPNDTSWGELSPPSPPSPSPWPGDDFNERLKSLTEPDHMHPSEQDGSTPKATLSEELVQGFTYGDLAIINTELASLRDQLRVAREALESAKVALRHSVPVFRDVERKVSNALSLLPKEGEK